MFKVTIKLFLTLPLLDVMNTLIYHIFTCDLWLINSRFTIIAIETIFKTENSIKISFIKKTIHQTRFVFFPTEHMRTLISKEMKHSIITLLQNAPNLASTTPCLNWFDFCNSPSCDSSKLYNKPHPILIPSKTSKSCNFSFITTYCNQHLQMP